MKALSLTDRRMIAVKILNKVRVGILQANVDIKNSREFIDMDIMIKESPVMELAGVIEEDNRRIKIMQDNLEKKIEELTILAIRESIVPENDDLPYNIRTNPENVVKWVYDLMIKLKTKLIYEPAVITQSSYNNDVDMVAVELLEFSDGKIIDAINKMVSSMLAKLVNNEQ